MIKILGFLILALSSTSHGDFFGPSGAKEMLYGLSADTFGLSLESSYATTKANFDPNGNAINLAGNQSSEIRLNFLGLYDFTNFLSTYAEFTFVRNDASSTTIERTNSGFSQAMVGLEAVAYSGFIRLTPEVNFTVPFVSQPDNSTTNALIGNGVFVATAKVNLNRRFRHIALFGYGGYSYSSGGISANVPYGLLVRGDLTSFFADLGLTGAFSMNTDQYSNNLSARQLITNTVDAGSLTYDAVNPAWTNVDADVGFRFLRNYAVSLGFEQTLAGQNTAQESRFMVNFIFNSTPVRSSTIDDNTQKFEVDTTPEDTRVKRN